MMQVLRGADYRRSSWKNGFGETAEIAVFPSGAGLNDFDWRVSMAEVTREGPFSQFPGIDRTLCVLEGELVLKLSESGWIPLNSASQPLLFTADVSCHARLPAGRVRDFNVMTRRGVWRHAVRRLEVDGAGHIKTHADVVVVFCESGQADVAAMQQTASLVPLHSAIVSQNESCDHTISFTGTARLLLAEIFDLG